MTTGMREAWVKEVIAAIHRAISDKSISKKELADGLEEIADHAGEWADMMRDELHKS